MLALLLSDAPLLERQTIYTCYFKFYEKTLYTHAIVFLMQMAFVEGPHGIFTLNEIVTETGTRTMGTIGRIPVNLSCNVNASTQYHTTHLFPVP